jgi:hypothetical protein
MQLTIVAKGWNSCELFESNKVGDAPGKASAAQAFKPFRNGSSNSGIRGANGTASPV